MRVSRARLRRGLLLVHGVIADALRRGWEVEAYSGEGYGARAGVAIAVREHRYPIEIDEETRTLPFIEADIEKWRNESWWGRGSRTGRLPPPQRKRKEPTGKLRLVLPNGYGGGRASWTDGARSLDGRFDHVFEVLERRVVADDAAVIERRRRDEERRRAEEQRMERERLRRIDDARHERATAEMHAWRSASQLAEYAAALRSRLPDLASPERERIASWCDWLEERVRRSDPVQTTSLIVGLDDERDGRGW
jgi:hypothetical protein